MRLYFGALAIFLFCLHCADSFEHKTFRGFGKKMRRLDFSTADAEVITSVALRASLLGLATLFFMDDNRSTAIDRVRGTNTTSGDQMWKPDTK